MDCKTFDCICDRPKKLIHCWKCGKKREGRVKLKCRLHPKVTFLMDTEVCPFCKSSHIVEVRHQLTVVGSDSSPHTTTTTTTSTTTTTMTNNNNNSHSQNNYNNYYRDGTPGTKKTDQQRSVHFK